MKQKQKITSLEKEPVRGPFAPLDAGFIKVEIKRRQK